MLRKRKYYICGSEFVRHTVDNTIVDRKIRVCIGCKNYIKNYSCKANNIYLIRRCELLTPINYRGKTRYIIEKDRI